MSFICSRAEVGFGTGFLDGTNDALRPQTEKFLRVLGVTEKSIFGISLSAVLDRIKSRGKVFLLRCVQG